MNHAGGLGFEAVAAGHFDDLGVPEVLLQRRMEMSKVLETPLIPPPTTASVGSPKPPMPAKRAAPKKKNAEAAKK
jgi:hypothetical protein